MIADLEYQQNAPIEAIFRIHNPTIRTARNNSRYLYCILKDRTGQIPAYAWLDRYHGDQLEEKTLATVYGSMRWFADRWHVDISAATLAEIGTGNPLPYLPDDYSPVANGVQRLEAILSQLKIMPLREFVLDVLQNDSVALPFFALPASQKHHHAYAGGLLEHSLECAEFVIRATECMHEQEELAVCAALLHDIGKTRTLNRTSRSLIGALLGHDLLTLELLAQPLAQLDRVWPDGATALRYLLSWKLQCQGNKRPLMTVAEVVQAADRASCGYNNETTLFEKSPAWKKLVSDEVGRKFWRPEKLTAYAA
jgi:putative nucleotidyltransferase with HDIG domain